MTWHGLRLMVAVSSAALLLAAAASSTPASAMPAGAKSAAALRGASQPSRTTGAGGGCSAGAHTLAPLGSRLYPDTGNGGYTSVHTLVHLVYDARTDQFLPGNRVGLTDVATQCLTSFSLDLERRSANTSAGPDLNVQAITVNGRPATFTFVQPTYPGDPNGQNDPNPAAHEVSQDDPVGGPQHNPLPPACSPELSSTSSSVENSQNGKQCPANKLVVTPAQPIRDGSTFVVSVAYTGRPGVHNDGDGTTEGWFRAADGGFVTTEPVGSEDWMPLNDYPTAKPTYDFSDTVNAGKVVIANGMLVSVQHHGPSTEFPRGSVTWNWHAAEPIASYLVEDSVGNYRLTSRTAPNGITFYQAQDRDIRGPRAQKNLRIMSKQAGITAFESQFSGPFPFTSDGAVVGKPEVSFDEEMETMITFSGGVIGTSVLYHENMHQWWGDNVTEGGYRMTFYKEGLATLAQFLYVAKLAENKAGGPGSRRGDAAFQRSLVREFDATYRTGGAFWTTAPSNPAPYQLFAEAPTYARPGIAYVALRQILGAVNFTRALEQIQRTYGGVSITEPELESGFASWLPVSTSSCRTRLTNFFQQWFDTTYPAGGGVHRPMLTGPGLAGPGFYGASGGCSGPPAGAGHAAASPPAPWTGTLPGIPSPTRAHG